VSNRDEDVALDTVATGKALGLPALGARYLAVFEPSSSRVVPLGERGELVIGRGDEAALRLDDVKVSRRHAILRLSPDEISVSDLDSQNGTFVNGDRVAGKRALSSGDAVEIGHSALVLHATSVNVGGGRRGLARLRAELGSELERAARAPRPLAIGVLALGDDQAERAAELLDGELVGLERLAVDGGERLVVMMPELSAEDALSRLRDLTELLARAGLAVRAGAALHPSDGVDPDALLAGARAAALVAVPGELRQAASAFRELAAGEARVLVADPIMHRLYALIERLAAADLTVLVTGETGAGKELAVQALHHMSPRAARRLVAINCAALQETLVESELFGHEKGAFTGAATAKLGLLEAAAGGTAFLDEVGELPLAVQAKLLRALDTKRIVRVGDVQERPIDVRVVAATHRDLERDVAEGRFRRDLFFRLSGATLWVPPLRDRPRELALLAQRFLAAARAQLGRPPMSLSDEALRALAAHPWPGNVRELKNVMEYCAAAFDDAALEAWHLSERLGAEGAGGAAAEPAARQQSAPPAEVCSLQDEIRDLERRRMTEALEATGGNQRRAAQRIGMPLRTFVTKLTQLGLRSRDD
jgi:DNA-binding NtrC family response regulator/pSer/pThr/pTyr-binding forkhead associated (FHA) protein